MPPHDPFSTLERMLAKYRRDVHRLDEPATADAIHALEAQLGRRLPHGLREFLARHNGAELFRGALRMRPTHEMGPASVEVRNVWVFADGAEGERWVFARNHDGGHAFGLWDGARLTPMHSTFAGWFAATLEVLDARVQREDDRIAIRLEADADDPWQLYDAGLRTLLSGRAEAAVGLLERATRADPTHVLAWQRLGDALSATDRVASRKAWLAALDTMRIPLDWPGAPLLDPEVFTSLARTFHDPEEWEHQLTRFLHERVTEVYTEEEFDLVVTATQALADSLVRRGRRAVAYDVLADLLRRSTTFRTRRVPWSAVLALAGVAFDLGRHDEAEKHIRSLRLEGPSDVQAETLLLLGRLAVQREEPWAEDILEDALTAAGDDDLRIQVALARVERATRQARRDEARSWLEAARRWVDQGAPRLLRAMTSLAEGDVARLSEGGGLDEAAAAWRRASEILGDRAAPELRLRLDLRFGDLAYARGDRAEAAVRYRAAAQGYAAQELPVREAWALCRLARVVPDPSGPLASARNHFLEADLAAGVAAVDALREREGASLAWHLDRAAEHMAARTHAQRARAPWTRSDAERPERRLGAHRMAIASCPDVVLRAVATELDIAVEGIRGGRTRPLDAPVLRYAAAVHLIAGHRSWLGAQLLLRELVEPRVDGAARAALLGALQRSPNAALVDGLLGCVEDPNSVEPAAVAAAAEVLGLRRESEAVAALRELAKGANAVLRKAAIVALGRIGAREAAPDLVPALDEPALSEAAGLGLLLLGDRRGLDYHARALTEGRLGLGGQPGELVGRYGTGAHLQVLYPASLFADDDIAKGAIHGLGLLGDAAAVPHLLRLLDGSDASRNTRRDEAVNAALQLLTGHLEDADVPDLHRRWTTWWVAHQARFQPGVRHRQGRVLDLGQLVHLLESDDAWVRRTAWEELVVQSGERLPLDVDGPWRVQRAQVRAWRTWWTQQRHRFPPGRWFLDGRDRGMQA
jgi:HEAT repeat protein